MRLSLDENRVVVAVMIDYTAAFPSIHQIEIFRFCRLCNFNDDAVLFIHDCHTPVFFFISCRNRLFLITSGIKQSSVPGLVLFVGGSNSVDAVVQFCKRKYFVDDEDFYLDAGLNELPRVIEMFNRDLSAVATWAESIGIRVNGQKAKAMIFGSSTNLRRIRQMFLPPIVLNSQIVPL